MTSKIPGASIFSSIIFSKPLAIEATTNICGIMPIKVAAKKLTILTLNLHLRLLRNGKPFFRQKPSQRSASIGGATAMIQAGLIEIFQLTCLEK